MDYANAHALVDTGWLAERLGSPGLRTIDATYFLPGAKRDAKAEFAAAGLDLDRPITASCGSGVTASMLAFGLYLIGKKDVAVYDGSWSEWGMRQDTPIET